MELVAILNGEKKPLQLEAEATGSDLFRALANGFDVPNMIFKVLSVLFFFCFFLFSFHTKFLILQNRWYSKAKRLQLKIP